MIQKAIFYRAGLAVLVIIFITGFVIFYKYMLQPQPIVLGIYDPSGIFNDETKIKIQSVYISWGEDSTEIANLLNSNDSLNRVSLVTVEPWQNTNTAIPGKELLTDIGQGKYDKTINRVCDVLANTNSPVIVRWGHEMELTTSRYPWAGNDPSLYVQAYKHFVDLCKTHSQNFKFMWSPAGEDGSEKYWPGNNYVDYIGLSVYSYDEWDLKYVGHKRSFSEVLIPKYDRIKQFNKPLIIAESGVTGDESYKKEWIGGLVHDINNFKLLKGFVYFNSTDLPGAWGNDLGIADFRTAKETLTPLIKVSATDFNLK